MYKSAFIPKYLCHRGDFNALYTAEESEKMNLQFNGGTKVKGRKQCGKRAMSLAKRTLLK